MNDDVAYFPLDVRGLDKGHTITAEEIERLTGTPRRHESYPLKLLWIRGKIDRELKKLGRILTMRIHKGSIIVCSDSEAAKYNRRQGRLKILAYKRAHARNVAVELNKLDANERAEHERTLVLQGTMIGAMQSARRKLGAPTATARRVPALTDMTVRAGPAGNGQ